MQKVRRAWCSFHTYYYHTILNWKIKSLTWVVSFILPRYRALENAFIQCTRDRVKPYFCKMKSVETSPFWLFQPIILMMNVLFLVGFADVHSYKSHQLKKDDWRCPKECDIAPKCHIKWYYSEYGLHEWDIDCKELQ